MFFRSLRALVERFESTKIYFVLEGVPVQRLTEHAEYKANRAKVKNEAFIRQRYEIINLLETAFPICVIRHPEYECDDVIGSLVNDVHANDTCVVVSTDTDFIQLLSTTDTRVKLYNPIKKTYMIGPEYDYVCWKALRGDTADNIKGFPGIGDKRATLLMTDQAALTNFLNQEHRRETFDKNVRLIRFHDLCNRIHEFETSEVVADWKSVHRCFKNWGFSSLTKSTTWDKFWMTFEKGLVA